MMLFDRMFKRRPSGNVNLEQNKNTEEKNKDDLGRDVIKAQQQLRSCIERWSDVSGDSFVPWAKHLEPHRLVNCRVLSSRYHLLDLLPKNSICVEVGTQAGNFARQILDKTKPKVLHILDSNMKLFQAQDFKKEIESGQIRLHEGDSSIILSDFPDRYFDWIYIDGDHEYMGVKKDLAKARLKLKDGGLIVCNDYTHWSPPEVYPYGIPRAVNELCTEDNWELVYFAFQGQGYHDICIRRIV